MDETTVSIAVTCPHCGTESLSEFPVIVVVTALTRWNNMALYAACHQQRWDASTVELQGIRRQMGEEWIRANSKKSPT